MTRAFLTLAAAIALSPPAAVSARPVDAPAGQVLSPPAFDEETEATRSLIERFVHMLYGEKRVREAFENFVREDYIQHNPRAEDGREAAIGLLTDLFAASPDRQFDVRRMIVDGDIAAVHHWSRATPEDRGHAVVDIFRIEGGRIAEHWDVIQPVPEEAANDHPMF